MASAIDFLRINCGKSLLQLTGRVVCLADVDVVNPDEKSIMTYVAQFLKYSRDAPGAGASAQVWLPTCRLLLVAH